MRCLFCGKELALLKRLTNGDDFCSEEHRRSYQNQFNELALGRLQQSGQVQQRFVARELAREEYGEIGLMEDGTSGSEFQGAPFVPDIFEPYGPPESKFAGLSPADFSHLAPNLPERDFQPPAREQALRTAPRIRWNAGGRPVNQFAGPRNQTLEARDVSRAATLPALRPQSAYQREVFVPVAYDQERQIAIDPRSPGPAKPWRARGPAFDPTPFEQIAFTAEPGSWTHLDWTPLGAESWIRPSGKAATEAAIEVTANLASLERAVSVNRAPSPQLSVAPPPEPERVLKPVPVTLHGVSPVEAMPATVALSASRSAEPRVPVAGALPLRPLMLVGTAVASAGATLATQPGSQQTAQPSARASQPAAQPAAKSKPTAPPAAPPAPQPAARVRPEIVPAPATESKRTPEALKSPAAAQVAPEPVAPTPVTPVQAATQATPAPVAPEAPRKVTNKVRRDVRIVPAAGRATEPEQASQDKPPAPATKIPPPRPEAPVVEVPELHLVQPEKGFSALSQGMKLAIGAGVIVAMILAWFLISSGSGNKKVEVDPSVVNGYEVGQSVVNMGWIENWAPPETGKRISLFKGSQQLGDYRMEFKAAIQSKAIGWMFRGMNPRNYYVAKIETLKPGPDPTVALVRYAVIDGKPEGRNETVLPFKVRPGMEYKIRFEAVRSRFTAYVQDQKVDEWHDTRIGSGAVGMYSEPGEAALVDGIVSLTALVPK